MVTITTPTTPAAKEAAPPAHGFSLKAGNKPNMAKINAAAAEFESHFIEQMLSTMFSTVEPNEELGGGDAEEVYQSLLVNEYGKVLAKSGGIGVADQVKQIMLSQQEVE